MNSIEPTKETLISTDEQSENHNDNSSKTYFDIYGPQVINNLLSLPFLPLIFILIWFFIM